MLSAIISLIALGCVIWLFLAFLAFIIQIVVETSNFIKSLFKKLFKKTT